MFKSKSLPLLISLSILITGTLSSYNCSAKPVANPNSNIHKVSNLLGNQTKNAIANGNLIPVMHSNNSPLGVAYASSVFGSSFEPWKAFDGNDVTETASRWISEKNMPQWLAFKFNAPTTVNSYHISPEVGRCIDRSPKNFQLQGSNDGNNWVTLDSRSNITLNLWQDGKLTFDLQSPATYSTFRLYVTAVNGSDVVSIKQLGLYPNTNHILETPNLIPTMLGNICNYGEASASSIFQNDFQPWKAFDGNDVTGTASRWISKQGMPQWLAYTFYNYTTVKSYYIAPEVGNCINRSPKNFQLEGSVDGKFWLVLDTQSNITIDSWKKGGLSFNLKQPASCKIYRLYINDVNGSDVVSIKQFKLFNQIDPII